MPTCNNPIHLLPNIVVIWLPLLRESNLLCYTLSVFIELSIKKLVEGLYRYCSYSNSITRVTLLFTL